MKITWHAISFAASLLLACCSPHTSTKAEGNPYSKFVSNPNDSQNYVLPTKSAIATNATTPAPQAGIGAALRIENGKVLVTKVLPDTPAALSNLIKSDDQIIAIAEANEKPITVTGEKELARVVGMIRGPVKSVVRLTIIPKGKSEADCIVVSLVRGNIKEIDRFFDGRLLPPGTEAPKFKFTRFSDSQETSLSQFAGRVVVIEFCASWCGPCMKALEELDSLRSKHPEWEGRVELLAISVDETKEDVAAIAKIVHCTNVSIGWAGPAVLEQYRVAGLPTVFIVDQKGNITAADHRLDIPADVARLLKNSTK